jgi:hypothetical protein
MSETRVPNEESVLPDADQMAVGRVAASDEDAVLVFALTRATTDDEALFTSDCSAKAPELRVAPVKVRVVLFHTSAINVPNVVKLRALYDQIDPGNVAKRDEEALVIVV